LKKYEQGIRIGIEFILLAMTCKIKLFFIITRQK
jgi:hypothetical protein